MKIVSTTSDLARYYSDRSVAAPIADMADAGFKHLDLSLYCIIYEGSPWIAPGDAWKREVEAAAEASVKYGVDFCQSHAPDGEHFRPGEARDALILATRRTIEACGMLGIPNTVIHTKSAPSGTREDFVSLNTEFFRFFEADAEKYNVEMLAENSADLWNPHGFVNTAEDLLSFLKAANLPMLHACWDTGHANVMGLNQYDSIRTLGSELRAVHLQDNYGNGDSHIMPMAGTVNFDQVLRGFVDTGYRGCFTFEGSNTLRRGDVWPDFRRDRLPGDLLRDPPLSLAKKQLSVMLDVGKWMLEAYRIPVE